VFLTAMRRRPDAEAAGFPWTLPVFAALQEIAFEAPVTLLVGENGCGKSTLLEAVAVGMGAVAVGSRDVARDPSLAPAAALAGGFRFARRRAPRRRVFLRAEDVLGYQRRLAAEMSAFAAEGAEMEADLAPDASAVRRMAAALVGGQRHAFAEVLGGEPEAHSHGEAFLALLRRRLLPDGLFLLDEPETPLSPTRILALVAMVREAVARGGQFLIATHSPMLMAVPGARILVFEGDRIVETPWEEVEHVRLTRAFLADPEAFLRRL
jgi:predicted ATPase